MHNLYNAQKCKCWFDYTNSGLIDFEEMCAVIDAHKARAEVISCDCMIFLISSKAWYHICGNSKYMVHHGCTQGSCRGIACHRLHTCLCDHRLQGLHAWLFTWLYSLHDCARLYTFPCTILRACLWMCVRTCQYMCLSTCLYAWLCAPLHTGPGHDKRRGAGRDECWLWWRHLQVRNVNYINILVIETVTVWYDQRTKQ